MAHKKDKRKADRRIYGLNFYSNPPDKTRPKRACANCRNLFQSTDKRRYLSMIVTLYGFPLPPFRVMVAMLPFTATVRQSY